MRDKHPLSTTATLLLTAIVLAYTTSCGTLMHPERSGKAHSDRVDATIAILDGVGCLFFLIPGLVAFAVDFYTGAIYLPVDRAPGANATPGAEISDGVRVVRLTPEELTRERIEAVISQHVGRPATISRQTTSARRLDGPRDIRKHIARFALAVE